MDTARIITAFLIGTVGFSIFLYGKREARLPQVITGMLLMASPFAIRDPLWMGCAAVLLIAALKVTLQFESRRPAGN